MPHCYQMKLLQISEVAAIKRSQNPSRQHCTFRLQSAPLLYCRVSSLDIKIESKSRQTHPSHCISRDARKRYTKYLVEALPRFCSQFPWLCAHQSCQENHNVILLSIIESKEMDVSKKERNTETYITKIKGRF
jgi:hypothetical protein